MMLAAAATHSARRHASELMTATGRGCLPFRLGTRHETRTNALAAGARRSDRRRGRVGELRRRRVERRQLVAAWNARRHVRDHRVALRCVERVERQGIERRERFVVRHLAAHVRASRKGLNRSRSFCSASRIRVLIVPSGCPVCSAISD